VNLVVRTSGLRLTRAVRVFAESRVRAALGGLAVRARAIRVTLLEKRGPAGARQRLCRVLVLLPGLGPIAVRALADDRYLAISNACSRAAAAARQAAIRQPLQSGGR